MAGLALSVDPNAVIALIGTAMKIYERHKAAHPDQPPLTAEQVHAELVADLEAGHSTIAAEFAAKGWALPK